MNDKWGEPFVAAKLVSHVRSLIYLQGGFNNHIAEEFEHRNPFLGMILPWTSDHAVLRSNTQRFVTHRDLHATILGLLAPSEKQLGVAGLNSILELVPEKRSCNDAGIPPAWCHCFRPKHNKAELSVETEVGRTGNHL
jgi:hypothetical protein